MKDTIFRLPETDEMLRRLNAFNPSARKLHEVLAQHGGQQTTAIDFVMMYTLAAADYAMNLPPQMQAIVDIATHQYAKHLIDNDEALAEALVIIGSMGLPND